VSAPLDRAFAATSFFFDTADDPEGVSVRLATTDGKRIASHAGQVAVWVQHSGGPKESCITCGPDPIVGRSNFEGETGDHCKVQGHSAVICANMVEPIEVPFGCGHGRP